jgi:hypothetical protein
MDAHKNYNPGPGYDLNKALPSRRRPDAVNYEQRMVRELKPNNPPAIARGWRQLQKYIEELERITREKWQGFVDTYP